MIAIDSETTGLDVYSPSTRIILATTCDERGRIGIYRHGATRKKKLQAILASKEVKLFYNAKYDIGIFQKAGYKIRGPIIDVLLMARLICTDERNIGLKHMARKFLKDPYLEEVTLRKYIRKHKIKVKERGYQDVPDELLHPYAVKDVKATLKLYHYFYPALVATKQLEVFEREQKVQAITYGMERLGVNVNIERCGELRAAAVDAVGHQKELLVKLSGDPKFNPNSNKQVAPFIYSQVRCERFSDKTGAQSVDEVALLRARTDRALALLKYRKLKKAIGTYYTPIIKRVTESDSCTIHPSLNSLGTITGRYSSNNPNLQNIPRPNEHWLVKHPALTQVRSYYVPRKGFWFFFVDYEQIEIRLAAHFSQEQHMLEAIRQGKDLHGETTKLIFKIDDSDPEWDVRRYLAKKLNFSILYGVGAQKFADSVLKDSGIKISLQEAARYISDFKSEHPAIVALFSKLDREALRTGGVRNPFGRFVLVEQWRTYTAVNYLIQSTAADILKLALIKLHRFLVAGQFKTRMILTVHDEVVFEVPPEEKHLFKKLPRLMEYHKFSVPLTCSASWGKNWADKVKL